MIRAALRPWVAGLLLLCLGRTLLPEAWVLAWHPHPHTTREVAFTARRVGEPHQLLLSSRHQHCHAEQFYDVPFAAAAGLVLSWPRRRAHQAALGGAPVLARQQARGPCPTLRGPPLTLPTAA